MQSDDEAIVNRCLEGDQAAFAFLVGKYKETVHAYAYHRVSDYQDAQDITQEVFIKAYRKLAQLKWPHRFQSWLYTIASNECSTWLREHLKEREQEVHLEDVPAENLDALAVRNHSDEDIELTVRTAMETLPDDSQLALSLYYMSSQSVKEIAHFMGVSPNSVRIKLHRARKQLGERLEKMIGKHLSKEKLKAGFAFKVVDSIRDMPIPSLPKPRPIRWIPISIGMALLIGIVGYGVSSGKDTSPDMPILKPTEATFEVSLLPDTDAQAVSDTEALDVTILATTFAVPQLSREKTDISESDTPMSLIPAGEFQMGSNEYHDTKPVHTVHLDAFYIDRYEVTNAQYAGFLNEYGKNTNAAGYELLDIDSEYCMIEKRGATYRPKAGYANHPVVVSWYGAMAYAQFCGKRLPTEAEWEKAARGGTAGRKYPWGDEINPARANYNFDDSRICTPAHMLKYLKPVGSFLPNGYGLYDVAGNVWEWCADEYDRDYYSRSARRNPEGGQSDIVAFIDNVKHFSFRVLRGGSWLDGPEELQVVFRGHHPPPGPYGLVGFRCVVDAKL